MKDAGEGEKIDHQGKKKKRRPGGNPCPYKIKVRDEKSSESDKEGRGKGF